MYNDVTVEYVSESKMVSRIIKFFRRRNDGDDPDCNDVRELSSDYIDGDLDPQMADKIKAHISWCGPCNAFISTLMSTVSLLRNSPKKQAPPNFRNRVKEHLKRSTDG